MSFKYIYLRGNPLLIIFKKFLDIQNINLFEFFDKQFNNIIEQNFEEFIERMENQNIKFPEFSGLDMYVNSLKNDFLDSKLKNKEFKVS